MSLDSSLALMATTLSGLVTTGFRSRSIRKGASQKLKSSIYKLLVIQYFIIGIKVLKITCFFHLKCGNLKIFFF